MALGGNLCPKFVGNVPEEFMHKLLGNVSFYTSILDIIILKYYENFVGEVGYLREIPS